MGILSGAIERREKRLGDQNLDWIGGGGSASGVSVTHASALTISAVFACVRILSETLASLPLFLYERRGADGKRRAVDHSLYGVLHDLANPAMTSFTFREVLMSHVATWGNGYGLLVLDNRGAIQEVWPLRPDVTVPVRINGDLFYYTQRADAMGGDPVYIPAEFVFHVHGLGFDGLQGYSVIHKFRESLGLSIAAERYGARFFGNGARPGLVLQYPGKLGPEGLKNVRESWTDQHGGLDRSNRIAILEEGMTIETIGLPPEEAQFLETRRFQVSEVARIFRIPPHLIGDLDKATFSNIEHQGIEFVIHTMRPWLVRWEQEIKRQMLLPKERARYYPEFLVDGLLRGDTAGRYSAYSVGRQGGWLSANDIRRLENMDPIPGGDSYLIPLNMVEAGAGADSGRAAGGRWRVQWDPPPLGRGSAAGDLQLQPGTSGDLQVEPLAAIADLAADLRRDPDLRILREQKRATSRHRLIGTWRPLYAEAAGRLVRRETNDLINAARRFDKRGPGGLGEFLLFVDQFERDFLGVVAGELRPVSWSYADLIAAEVSAELGDLEAEGARGLTLPEARQEGEPAPWEPWAQRYTEAAASRWTKTSAGRISEVVQRAIAEKEPWIVALEAEFDHAREVRPGVEADRESVQFNSGLAVALYAAAGVRRIRWVAIGKSCPYCRSLHGKTVAIEGSFLGAGAFQPEGVAEPLIVKRRVGHAPAHKGCDCLTMAGI